MAESFDVANIEFAQADIMMLSSLGRQFDFIDASGVLHHLADPWSGWSILLSLLRPGGVMQVGLYSEAARQNVVAARALIAERGYRPDPDGIRRCRANIMAADDPLLKSVATWEDFFTIAECRDLLFHVQEHRITLPQIKSFIAANNVEFSGFIPVPSQLRIFAERFAERSALLDLDCWHTLETENARLIRGDVPILGAQAAAACERGERPVAVKPGSRSGSGRDCRRQRRFVAAQPGARRALGGGDLDVGHLIGDLAPQPNRLAVAFHRREIEPLMRGNEIDRRIATDRVHHSELEQHIARGRAFAERRRITVENFITSHDKLPCPFIPACPLSRFLPQSIRDNPQKI